MRHPVHLFQVAAEMNLEKEMRLGLNHGMVASIGPTTSEELSRLKIRVDLEPSHPKMGFLEKTGITSEITPIAGRIMM